MIGCTCGGNRRNINVEKIVRHFDKLITVTNVPVIYCDECETEYLIGSNALKMYSIAKEAFENDKSRVEFK